MGLIFKDADNKPIDPKAARIRAILFSPPFAFMGIFALVLLLHDGLHRRPGPATCHGTFERGRRLRRHYCAHFWNQRKKAGARNRSASIAGDEKPWLKRKEWADGRITTSARKADFAALDFCRLLVRRFRRDFPRRRAATIASRQSCRAHRADFSGHRPRHCFFCAENDARVAQIQPECF